MLELLEKIGPAIAELYEGGTRFRLWAPKAKKAAVVLKGEDDVCIPMQEEGLGYWFADAKGVENGSIYMYRLDDKTARPDPCSLFQKKGVHAASCVVDTKRFSITPLPSLNGEELVFYEMHIGTFTQEGTFKAAAEKISYLKELGVNAIELMPVSAFPGKRNWGYDGVYPYAVQESYGGPEGLALFVDRCHGEKIAVFLDVVYNHLGPEGNYLREFGPYFTKKYTTPWGEAVNFDDKYSYGVRKYFIDNAIHWFSHYDIDGLRLDAVHGIFDMSAKHFLSELSGAVEEYSKRTKKRRWLIAESDLNDRRIIDPARHDGYGLHAQWLDDFHHAAHALLTKEKRGYYADFGHLEDLQASLNRGFVYGWHFSRFRKRFFGSDSSDIDPSHFIAFIQNHDQVGNRPAAERLSISLGRSELGLAAGLLLLSPYMPMLFMGEEYGETAPFHYFINHGDARLVEAVRRGRKREFKGFRHKGEFHDPQSEETFIKSKLDWALKEKEPHKTLLSLYKRLINFRKNHPVYQNLKRGEVFCTIDKAHKTLFLHLGKDGGDAVVVVFNFGKRKRCVKNHLPGGGWRVELDSGAFLFSSGHLEREDKEDKSSPCVQPKSFLILRKEAL